MVSCVKWPVVRSFDVVFVDSLSEVLKQKVNWPVSLGSMTFII